MKTYAWKAEYFVQWPADEDRWTIYSLHVAATNETEALEKAMNSIRTKHAGRNCSLNLLERKEELEG